MQARMIRTLQPSYMKNFRCIGGACEHNCCLNWHVSVDQRSYERYMRIKEGPLGDMFTKNILKNPAEKLNPLNYAHIKMEADWRCPFLNDQMLCHIQKELGEKYLCNVCFTYPRVCNRIDGVLERSLMLSCPEAARLVLCNQEYMVLMRERSKKAERISFSFPAITGIPPGISSLHSFSGKCAISVLACYKIGTMPSGNA